MIFKSFIVEKNISELDSYFATLFHGENIGLKDDFKTLIKIQYKDYDQISLHQNDILKKPNLLSDEILNSSLFSKKKIIFINDLSEKLKSEIIEITEHAKEDIKVFLFSENLDRKSVIRSHFEKGKNLAIVPCYQDNEKTLSIYLRNRLGDYEGLNQEIINILIKNSGEDRKVLSQEIEKIKGLFITKKIDPKKVISLINNAYNVDFDQLRDSSLEANKKDLNKDLGNIPLQSDKAYFYLSNLSIRIQKLSDLKNLVSKSNDVDLAMDTIRPKIFWKDKPIYKKQLNIWNKEKLEKAKTIIFQNEIVIKTKLGFLGNILIKQLLIDLCKIAETNS